MVDSMVSSIEDYLIEGLSFKLNPGASYVTDRRSVSFFTAGSNYAWIWRTCCAYKFKRRWLARSIYSESYIYSSK